MTTELHAACVDQWLRRVAAQPAPQLLSSFEGALTDLWTGITPTLSPVTSTAIAEQVLRSASAKFPPFGKLKVDPGSGIQCGALREELPAIQGPGLSEGICFVLVELLTVLGKLTAELFTPELHARLGGRAAPLAGPLDGAAAHRRLEHLYEVTKLFVSFEDIDRTLDPVLQIAATVLPLRSAILIEAEASGPKMIVWAAPAQGAAGMRAARAHAEASFTYLVGGTLRDLELREHEGKTPLPPVSDGDELVIDRFIVIPLVVTRGQPFGALQVESASPLDKADLSFINAVGNQLAVALDRSRAWQRDISLRKDSEDRRVNAELRSVSADRDRLLADSSRNEYQALAEENATFFEEAQKAIAVREQVLEIVSHDLRSPLGTILLATAILDQPAIAGEPMDPGPSVAKIRRAAERMVRLIDDLLDFASIEAGTLAIKPLPEDPGSMLDEIISTFEGAAKLKSQRLSARSGLGLPSLRCDRDRVLQVLSNLVGNATKITAPGGKISLSAEARGPDVVFSVADTGPGISEVEAKHLFERYWRSKEVGYKGNGLGLGIAKGIVRAHGGRIWVESVPGTGATFFFSIPIASGLGGVPARA